jgi:hypothetical protein
MIWTTLLLAAQLGSGAMTGTVRDQAGAAVPARRSPLPTTPWDVVRNGDDDRGRIHAVTSLMPSV